MEPQKDPNEMLKTARQVQHIENKVSFVSNVFTALIFLVVAGAITYFFTQKVDDEPIIVYIFPVAFACASILAVTQSYKKTKKKLGPATASMPFSGSDSTSTVTKQPYPRAILGNDVQLSSWLGALDRTDVKGWSTSVGLKEYVNSAENTLLVVNNQLIALAFTQEDFNLLGDGGGFMSTVAQFAATDDSAAEQKQNLSMLNYKKWPQMVEHANSQGLVDFVNAHYNFALPFGQIQSIEPRTGFLNPGVFVHLTDGTTLKYNTMIKEQIQPFVDALQAQGVQITG